jgi:type II secretory pathway pseudopilin PulG
MKMRLKNFVSYDSGCCRGQTLIETVIALAVVLILVSALLSLSVTSIRSATLSRNKTAASQLAYQQSDLIRNLRDSSTLYAWNWTNFTSAFTSANCSSSCYVNGTTFSSGTTSSTIGSTNFTIWVNGGIVASPASLNYTVNVNWVDTMGSHSERISSILTPWK